MHKLLSFLIGGLLISTASPATAVAVFVDMCVIKSKLMAMLAVCLSGHQLPVNSYNIFGAIDVLRNQPQMIDIAAGANSTAMIDIETISDFAIGQFPDVAMDADTLSFVANHPITVGVFPASPNVTWASKFGISTRHLVVNDTWRRSFWSLSEIQWSQILTGSSLLIVSIAKAFAQKRLWASGKFAGTIRRLTLRHGPCSIKLGCV